MIGPMKRFLGLPLEEKMILSTVLFFILLGIGLMFKHDTIIDFVESYGLVGLFFVAFIGSTVFLFFPVEAVFFLFLESGIGPFTIVAVATFGSLLGTCVNYLLGFIGSGIIEQRVDHSRIAHAKKLMNRYGWFGLFVVIALPLPTIPVDPITLIPGIARMNFIEFTITVTAAKVVKYAFYTGIFLGIINGFL